MLGSNFFRAYSIFISIAAGSNGNLTYFLMGKDDHNVRVFGKFFDETVELTIFDSHLVDLGPYFTS